MSILLKQSRIRGLTRRACLVTGMSATGLSLAQNRALAQNPAAVPAPARKPPLPLDLVREFVGVAHSDLKRTQELLTSESELLNASWDWGAGDFETALGAAGHMGRPDIAAFLLGRGARMDLFCAAMLGQVEIVSATLRAYPLLKSSKGPHGIPLIMHARAGLRQAIPGCEQVLKLIETL